MSFLSRLFFKKKSATSNAQAKSSAKAQTKSQAKLDSLQSMPLEELMTVIQNSSDEKLRHSALQKINQLSTLLTLADINSGKTSVNSLQKSAKKRIAQLLDSSEISGAEFCRSVEDPLQRFAILGLMTDQQLAEKELSDIQDETLLVRVVQEAPSSRLRQLAAEKIQNAEHLFLLLKEFRNADKSVYKILKEKCDLIKEQEKAQQAIIQQQNELLSGLEHQAQRVYDIHYAAKFHYLQEQWLKLTKEHAAVLDVQTIQRVQAAIDACAAKVEAHTAEEVAEEKLRNALRDADQQITELTKRLDSILVNLVNASATDDEVRNQLMDWQAQWAAIVQLKMPNKSIQEKTKAQQSVISSELEARAELGSLKEHSYRLELQLNHSSEDSNSFYQTLRSRCIQLKPYEALLKDWLAVAETACQAYQAKQTQKVEAEQSKLRQLSGLIRKVREALDQGELKKASSLRHAIEEKRTSIERLPTQFVSQIEQLDESINKLNDWKEYAVAPKKLELIAQMEALVGSNVHPETLAEKIKRLQEEWKLLSKGSNDQDLWEKFHSLAQKAYEPCQIYFADQAALRATNLEKCKTLVAQLRDYLDQQNWEAFDWRDAEKVIRVARQEWRNYSPTERVVTQPVLKEFESHLEAIYQKILHAQEAIAEQKQAMIHRALQLVTMDDMRKSIDAVKALQAEWQAHAVCGHKKEQQLWQAFRDACDQVFAKRQQQSAEFKAELETNQITAQQLLQGLKAILNLSGKELLEARAQVDEVRKNFSGLGQLPKAQVQEIRNQFQQAFHDFDEKVKTERAAAKQQIWINLFAGNEAVAEFERSLNKADDTLDTQRESLKISLQELSPLPTGGLKALQQKLDQVVQSSASNIEENTLRLRKLCIQAELLTGQESPSAEISLRKTIQVEQLQQNFGRKVHNIIAEMESLVFEWLQVGAIDKQTYANIFARFNACLLKSLAASEQKNK